MTEHTTRIQSALDATPMDHRKTLFGERPAGSKWGRGFRPSDWNDLLPRWRVLDGLSEAVRQERCAYYEANVRDVFPFATVGAVPYADLSQSEKELAAVTDGPHGPELVAPSLATRLRSISVATLILGPHRGLTIVYTIHPGLPLAPFDGTNRNPETAVKLVAS